MTKWILLIAVFAGGVYVAYEHPAVGKKVYVYTKQVVSRAANYVEQLQD